MDIENDEVYKKIIARRDRRYDGRFYFGVKTTGIYCRPVCPAIPKPKNIRVFKSASAAEAAGYRACLRCHPDLAPGSKMLDGTANTVSRALRLIQDPTVQDFSVPRLATSLGMSDRHLRRLFDEHLGASPIDIILTQKLHYARQLISETPTPITDIAFAVGFQSIRRFNEAFKNRYRRPPSAYRKSTGAPAPDGLSLKIPIHLPYDWPTMLAYLKRHEAYGLERVENNSYRRYIIQGSRIGSVVVSHTPGHPFLNASFVDVPLTDVRMILGRLRVLFDTDHNPVHLPSDGTVVPNGIRVPGSFDPFETAISIILSQLVSTEHAKATLKNLIIRYGRHVGTDNDQDVYTFPPPSVLAKAKRAPLKIPKTRARAIRELSMAILRGRLRFTPYADLTETRSLLLSLHGIGPWTAAVIAMRCLSDADAFPSSDLVIARILKREKIQHADWASSRAYLTHSLWRGQNKPEPTRT